MVMIFMTNNGMAVRSMIHPIDVANVVSDKVVGGTANVSGAVLVEVSRVGNDSALQQLVAQQLITHSSACHVVVRATKQQSWQSSKGESNFANQGANRHTGRCDAAAILEQKLGEQLCTKQTQSEASRCSKTAATSSTKTTRALASRLTLRQRLRELFARGLAFR